MSEQDQNTSPGYSNQRLTKDQQDQLLFMMLVQQHEQICMMGLGKIKNPGTDKIERDMGSAKYAIDTLEMLQRYTKNNLPNEVDNFLEQTLTNLRLNYVDESSAEKNEKRKDESSEKKDETEGKE
ncbi:MAG TPA: DUF1844 domain-containing protein [Balneolales bacterium]|nr:DUF1844 domain-containing protein [Balneolales bacterium]